MGDTWNESIYNLIKPPQYKPAKGERHASKFKSNVKDDLTKNKAEYKTMGPAKVQTRPPNEFMKKHEKEPKLPENTEKFKYPDDNRKPAVPRRDEQPIMGLKTNKNFITQNAVENIMSVPRKPERNYADTRKGDIHPLETSGLEPKYTHKKDFGQTPMYLEKRKAELKRAQEEYDNYVADHFRRGAMQQLSPEEREEILNGLKANWELLHHEYQGLSVVTDTAPKKNRKERMEAEMKQLERDIESIEKHKIIYIANWSMQCVISCVILHNCYGFIPLVIFLMNKFMNSH